MNTEIQDKLIKDSNELKLILHGYSSYFGVVNSEITALNLSSNNGGLSTSEKQRTSEKIKELIEYYMKENEKLPYIDIKTELHGSKNFYTISMKRDLNEKAKEDLKYIDHILDMLDASKILYKEEKYEILDRLGKSYIVIENVPKEYKSIKNEISKNFLSLLLHLDSNNMIDNINNLFNYISKNVCIAEILFDGNEKNDSLGIKKETKIKITNINPEYEPVNRALRHIYGLF